MTKAGTRGSNHAYEAKQRGRNPAYEAATRAQGAKRDRQPREIARIRTPDPPGNPTIRRCANVILCRLVPSSTSGASRSTGCSDDAGMERGRLVLECRGSCYCMDRGRQSRSPYVGTSRAKSGLERDGIRRRECRPSVKNEVSSRTAPGEGKVHRSVVEPADEAVEGRRLSVDVQPAGPRDSLQFPWPPRGPAVLPSIIT